MAKKQEQNTEDQNIFIAKAVKIGNSIGLIIPKNNVEYEGIVEGNLLKTWVVKTKEKKESGTDVKKEESNSR